MYVLKENGKKEEFNKLKIRNAIIQASNQIEMPNFSIIDSIVDELEEELLNWNEDEIEDYQIENLVMSYLYRELPQVAREYSSYKINRERINKNPTEIEKVLFVKSEINQENANKNAELTHIKNAYLAEIPSKEAMRKALPKECLEAHDKGVVYFHDMGYSIREITNCELANIDEPLQNGFELGGRWIEKPKSFLTACTVTTQLLTHITSSTYGGCTINLLHLAKFVDVSRQKIREQVKEEFDLLGINDDKKIEEFVLRRLTKEIKDGMQTFDYQNSTLCSSVGQAVFLTVSVYLNEDPKYTDDLILVFKEMLRQRIDGFPNKNGKRENPNFPKIIYALDKDTMKGGKYYDITKMCAECSSKRLVPDYMSVKKHLEIKGIFTPSMGCRALLSPYENENGELVTWGRWNCGVTSLNLPYITMENNPEHSEEILFKNLDHYLEIANRNIIWRINHVAKIKAKVCPVLWQYGVLAKLNPEDTLESMVYGGFSTVTLGYSGLYEAVKYITGKGHWNENGNRLAHKILDYLNCNNKKLSEKLNVSVALYGTPAETLTDKFSRACIRDFGHIGDGTQRLFETNSYHYPVFEKINAFEKLEFEKQFSEKTLGGSISYVEVPNLSNNVEAMLELIEYIGENCLYAEINSEISNCSTCGFNGYDFTKVAAEDGTVRWKCPQCGESDPKKVKTSYRICGYISNYVPNEGRSQDIMSRVKHLN